MHVALALTVGEEENGCRNPDVVAEIQQYSVRSTLGC